jgi:DNA-binding beta-propeller fold protein YncE
LALAFFSSAEAVADGPRHIEVEHFLELPPDVRHPESITSDSDAREFYVGTFDARTPENSRNNRLLRFSAEGRLIASRSFGVTPLTGIEFEQGYVYVLNFGASKLQRLPARFDSTATIEDVAVFRALTVPSPSARLINNPDGSTDEIRFGAAGVPGVNGMVFDRKGTLYVSDSFQGAIYRILNATTCAPCEVETISRDPLLATAGALPFGANGLALRPDGSILYINNAGDGRVLRMSLPNGPIEILAESVHGADGLLMHEGLLWIAANQADAVVAIDERGRERYRAGAFLGIGKGGAPLGLLFPASTAVLGEWMIVANLSLPLTPNPGDEWEELVSRWTLARFKLPN